MRVINVRLGGEFGSCEDRKKMDGFAANFIKRVKLRMRMFNAPA